MAIAAKNFFPLTTSDAIMASTPVQFLFPPGGKCMWIEKLAEGVLQVDTPIGPRYVQPTFKQRLYLLWIFRNFPSLPQQVLRPAEQQLIDRLWSENKFVSMSAMEAPNQPVIGTIERRMPTLPEIQASRKPMPGSGALQEQGREAASA
jgi:hypothetical protein